MPHSLPNPTYRLTPIGEYSPVAAAAASLSAQGVDPVDALRYAPIAAAIDDIDEATPINPEWPGIRIVDDVDPIAGMPAKAIQRLDSEGNYLRTIAYVLELHPQGDES